MEEILKYIENSSRLSPGEVRILLSEIEEMHNKLYQDIIHQHADGIIKDKLLALWRKTAQEIETAKLSFIPH